MPYVEGRSDPRAGTHHADDAATLEEQRTSTLWTQAHNHNMIRGNPRGRRRATEVCEANERAWSVIPGVRRVRVLKDDPVGWAVVIEFKLGVALPHGDRLPPLWVDGVRVIVTQPGSRNKTKAASMWGKLNARRKVEAMTKAFKAAVPKPPPPRPTWGSNVDPSKRKKKPDMTRSRVDPGQRTEAERAAARRVAERKRAEKVDSAWESHGIVVKARATAGDEKEREEDEEMNAEEASRESPEAGAAEAEDGDVDWDARAAEFLRRRAERAAESAAREAEMDRQLAQPFWSLVDVAEETPANARAEMLL